MHLLVVLYLSLAQYVVCTSYAIPPGHTVCTMLLTKWNGWCTTSVFNFKHVCISFRHPLFPFPILVSNIIRTVEWMNITVTRSSFLLLFFLLNFHNPESRLAKRTGVVSVFNMAKHGCCLHKTNTQSNRRCRWRRLLREGKADVGLISGFGHINRSQIS